jgi:hypothetical protein
MAYFSQDMKKSVVSRLKKDFPEWKFSVKVSDNNKLMVAVKSAPIDIWSNYVETVGIENLYGDNGTAQINHYYLENCFSGEILKQMQLLVDNMNLVGDKKDANYREHEILQDYVEVGYFLSLRIGTFDKPFEHNPNLIKKSKIK